MICNYCGHDWGKPKPCICGLEVNDLQVEEE